MEEIIKQYTKKALGVDVKKVCSYRKQWLIETNSGDWIAKRSNQQKSPLWLVKVSEELRNRGFLAMPTLRTDGKEWFFSSYIKGRIGNYSCPHEVSKMVKVLAQFHLAGQKIFAPSRKMSEYLLYHRLYRRLVQFYKIVNNAHKIDGELGSLIRAHGRGFYLDGLGVWERLQYGSLKLLADQECSMGNLAHRDLASHNWIIDKQGDPWLIDWDTADYDLQLGDLWQMSMRILTKNNWEESWINTIFQSYQGVRPLTTMEKDVLIMLFGFPNEFYREAIGLAYKKKGYREKNVLLYLKQIIYSRETWRNKLKQLGHS